MIEAQTRILRHIIDCDGNLPPECFNRVLKQSPITESYFHDYDAKKNEFSDNPQTMLFTYVKDYFEQFGACPSDDAITMELSGNSQLDVYQKKKINEVLRQIRQYPSNAGETPLLVTLVVEEYTRNHQTFILQRSTKVREEKGVDAANRYIISNLNKLVANNSLEQSNGIKTAAQLAQTTIQEMKQGKELVRSAAKYGWRKWDSAMGGGIKEGQVVCFAAGTNAGKSFLMQEIGLANGIDLGKRVVFWNHEMLEKQVTERVICRQTRIPLGKLQLGYPNLLPDEQALYDAAQDGIELMGSNVLFIDSSVCNTFSKLDAVVTEYFGENGIDLLVADYLDIIKPSKGGYSQGWERTSAVTYEMKDFVKKWKCAGVTATQFNRGGNKKKGDVDMTDLSTFEAVKAVDTMILLREDPDHPYMPPIFDESGELMQACVPGILQAKIERGRQHLKHSSWEQAFRLVTDFSRASLGEASDFSRSSVATGFRSRNAA